MTKDGLPEHNTVGPRCLRCNGVRVERVSDKGTLYDLLRNAGLLEDNDGNKFRWCPACGGSGLLTDQLERILTK